MQRVCLSCAEYSHRICICSSLCNSLNVSSSSRGCITHGHYPFDVRRNLHSSMSVSCKILHRIGVIIPPSSYNLHRRIHILVSSIRFRHETNTNRSSLHLGLAILHTSLWECPAHTWGLGSRRAVNALIILCYDHSFIVIFGGYLGGEGYSIKRWCCTLVGSDVMLRGSEPVVQLMHSYYATAILSL